MKLIQKLLLIAFLFLGSFSFAHASYNCNYLVGSWSNEVYDETQTLQRRMIETVSADGSYWIKFIFYRGENVVSERESHGNWDCSGETMTINYSSGLIDVYEILDLRKMTYKLRSSGGTVYEYFKVLY